MSASQARAAANSGSSLPRPDHVVIVLEENKDYATIVGSSSASYINELAREGALFTNSHGLEHPSQPNYLLLFSGSDYGIKNDKTPRNIFSGPSLCGSLDAAGLTFCGYAESLPAIGAMDGTAGRYARKHCPWTDFADVPASDNVPFGGYFPTTEAGYSKLPTVSFVVPNLDNDMHDGSVSRGDAWLKQNLNGYVQWAKTHNSLLIVTFDEDEGTQPNRIPTVFVGPMVHPGEYSFRIDHLSVLRTIEAMYGLPQLGETNTAESIGNVWQSNPTVAAVPTVAPAG
jgi:acid phosphatase